VVGLVGSIADIPELARASRLRRLGRGHTDHGDPLDDLILVRVDGDLGRLHLLRDPGLFCIFVRAASVPCLGPLVGAAGATPVFALAPAATGHEGLAKLLAVAKVEGLVAGLGGGGHVASVGSKEAVPVRATSTLRVSRVIARTLPSRGVSDHLHRPSLEDHLRRAVSVRSGLLLLLARDSVDASPC
jgi:hypothetical protein